MNFTKNKNYLLILCLLFFLLPSKVFSTDKESREIFEQAVQQSKAEKWRSAAKNFKNAELYAESPVLKTNALKKAASAYKKAKLHYKEYECINTLLTAYPDKIDYKKYLKRIYKIGNKYFKGYREQPFKWLPWIKNKDHSLEIYKNILNLSPYADFIPDMLLKMSQLYTDEGKIEKAISTLKKILNNHGDTKSARIALLDLAHIYIQLAEKGGGYTKQLEKARELLSSYIKKYPDTKEVEWAKNNLKKTYELEADALLKLAKFYKDKNPKATKRYIKQILVNYPETRTARKAKGLLNEIDMPLYPDKPDKKEGDKTKYSLYEVPKTSEDNILVNPQNSGGKWMTPLKDLNLEKQKKLQKKYLK